VRVVVDTNVVVSRFLSSLGNPARIFELWRQEVFELLASEPILAEYRRALAYDRVRARHRLSDDQLDEQVADLRRFIVLVEPDEVITAIPDDPDDDKFLECALAGGADYIVSGDRHLLRLQQFRGIQILTPAAFLALIEQEAQ
jgi:putative PIN family toxin of toxin-antitoxin system